MRYFAVIFSALFISQSVYAACPIASPRYASINDLIAEQVRARGCKVASRQTQIVIESLSEVETVVLKCQIDSTVITAVEVRSQKRKCAIPEEANITYSITKLLW